MTNKRESRLLTVITAVLTAVAVLSGAIAVPLLCRPFYYAHIGPLHLTVKSRLSGEEMRETYNEIMDYCLGLQENFSLTYLPWSEEGASHFADVRALFLLDLWIAVAAIGLLVAVWAIGRLTNTRPCFFKNHTPGFWAAVILLVTFLVLAVLAAMDFQRAFEVFHAVFFPGKENWIFDYRTDPVIRILPQAFFRNCALLVFCLISGVCGILMFHDHLTKKRQT